MFSKEMRIFRELEIQVRKEKRRNTVQIMALHFYHQTIKYSESFIFKRRWESEMMQWKLRVSKWQRSGAQH
jgi:hypothetical protein